MEMQSLDTNYGKGENKARAWREAFLPGPLSPRRSGLWLPSGPCPVLMDLHNVLR